MSYYDNAGDVPAFPSRDFRRDKVRTAYKLVITGSSGAVDTTNSWAECPDVTVTPGATGVYAVTFPKAFRATASVSVQKTSTIGLCVGTAACDAAAGTWQFTCYAAAGGSAAWPASGDEIAIRLELQTKTMSSAEA